VTISGYKFYAVDLAAAPNDFAWLLLRTIRHKRQCEPVADIDLSVCHEFGSARRDVQYKAFVPRHSVHRNPGRPFVQLPSRIALYLRPWLVSNHHDHPSLNLVAIGQAIVKAGIMKVIP
jgi:hypothetical protein